MMCASNRIMKNPTFALFYRENPRKTSARFTIPGIWTRDLPNASPASYHGATSLGNIILDNSEFRLIPALKQQ